MSNKISNFILNADVALTQFDSFTLEETTSNELKCSGNKLIKCTITCTLPNDIHISRVMLKLRKITGTRLSFYIANIIGNLIVDPGFVQEASVFDIEDLYIQYHQL